MSKHEPWSAALALEEQPVTVRPCTDKLTPPRQKGKGVPSNSQERPFRELGSQPHCLHAYRRHGPFSRAEATPTPPPLAVVATSVVTQLRPSLVVG
jgi:hypothetical protein